MRRSFVFFRRKGVDFLRNRFTNKGTAFTAEEREALGVTGLLPPSIETMDAQIARYYAQFQLLTSPVNRYQLLRGIMDNNITLYYALVQRYLVEILPVIYTPTVGEVCERYGALYQHDHGAYITPKERGRIASVLRNTRKPEVDVIVVTDGSRILGLGDLGANGMGISIGKCSLYVAGAGVSPSRVMPVMLDVGTNRESLRNDPMYLGQRIPRIADDEFYAVMDEFMEAVREVWPSAVVQFEDFSNNHCFDVLERYRGKYRCFNDDIQGTGAVVSAGIVNAIKASGTGVLQHRFVVVGAGSAAIGVVNNTIELCSLKFGVPAEALRNVFYLVDSKGLVTTTRGGNLESHKVSLARTDISPQDSATLNTLEAVVRRVRPTALIGLSGMGGAFTQEIVGFICDYCNNPLLFPLSNPTSKAEITAQDAYTWTGGRAIVASGSPFPQVMVGERVCRPSQGNNLYIFPGVGLGCSLARPRVISQDVLLAASLCLCDLVSSSDMERDGLLYPPIQNIRSVSRDIAVAVIKQIQKEGCAGVELPTDASALRELVEKSMWFPQYPSTSTYLPSQ